MSNCLFEATLQKIEHDCGCTPKNFIDVIEGYEICAGEAKKCMNDKLQVGKPFLLLLLYARYSKIGYGRCPHNYRQC